MILLQQMLAMLIFMLIGYILRKSGHLDQSGMNSLSFIIVNIGNPCMLISGAISRAEAPSGRMLLLTVILCFFVYGFTILCGLFVPRLLGTEPEDRGVSMVMLATPVGSLVAMIAQQNGADYTLASKGIALTTLLSIVTMPLVSLVMGI